MAIYLDPVTGRATHYDPASMERNQRLAEADTWNSAFRLTPETVARQYNPEDYYGDFQEKSIERMDAKANKNVQRAPGRFAQGLATQILGLPSELSNTLLTPLGLASKHPALGFEHIGNLIGADQSSVPYNVGLMTPWNPESAAAGAVKLARSPIAVGSLMGDLAALHGAPGAEFALPLMAGVMKQKGGNWLPGSIAEALSPLKENFGELNPARLAAVRQRLNDLAAGAHGEALGGTAQHFATGGSVSTNFDNWSDAQLKQFITTGQEPDPSQKYNAPPQRAEHVAAPAIPTNPDLAAGQAALKDEPWWRRALMGTGADLSALGAGVSDLGQLAFMPRGEKGDQLRQQLMAERKQRALANQALQQDPAAIGGSVAGQILTAAATPARLPAQVAVQSVLSGLTQPTATTGGIGSELLARGLKAGEVGALTLGMGKGVQALGTLGGAATKQYTDAGAKAMALRDAAEKELGVKLRIADLDPTSPTGMIERNLPGAVGDVEAQAAALRPHLDATVQVPSSTGRSYTTREVPGEGLRQGIVEAVDTLKSAAADKWSALDNYVNNNGLFPVALNQTSLASRKVSPDALALVGDYNPQVASWLEGLANVPTNQVGHIPFAPLNDMRMAVGKAVGKVSRDFERLPSTSAERAAARTTREELSNLYRTINTDLEGWGAQNAKNTEAVGLFKNANDFYRDRVVSDILANPVVSKATKGAVAGTNPKAFKDSEDIINAVVKHPEVVDRLRDSMSPKTAAMVDTLRTADAARANLLTGEVPGASLKSLGSLAGLAIGHPFTMAGEVASRVPGLRSLAQSRGAMGLHFAKDLSEGSPLGRIMYGAAQYPQEQLEDRLNYPLGSR